MVRLYKALEYFVVINTFISPRPHQSPEGSETNMINALRNVVVVGGSYVGVVSGMTFLKTFEQSLMRILTECCKRIGELAPVNPPREYMHQLRTCSRGNDRTYSFAVL